MLLVGFIKIVCYGFRIMYDLVNDNFVPNLREFFIDYRILWV